MSGSKSSFPAESAHPLELTVHKLPEPSASVSEQTRWGRFKMLLVLLVCAAPVVASYFTYYVIKPQGSARNYGELMMDLKPLPDVMATDLDGKTVALPGLRKQWLLVSVAGGVCDAQCERHLYLQRQIRESMGKDKDRIDWVWLINDGAEVRAELRPALKPATVLRVAPAALAAWLTPAQGRQLQDHLYVVDPYGQWMMRFPPEPEPKKLKADLERLLRASNSWDTAGR